MGVQGLHSDLFGLFACILLYIRMAIRMDSGSYSGHSVQDSALFVLFGSIWLVDSGRSFPYDTKKPKST